MPKTSNPNLDYIRRLYAPQDALLAKIDETLATMDMQMQVGPEEGKLLQMIIIPLIMVSIIGAIFFMLGNGPGKWAVGKD